MFRALTGLGAVTLSAERRTTPKRYGFCDVLVLGGGPSGVAAALAAAESGARVTIVDEGHRLGGASVLNRAERQALDALIGAAQASPRIAVLSATAAVGCYADRWVALAEPHRLTKMRAQAVVFATGVIEQPAVFRNNDLPGVVLASGAWRLAERYGIAPGRHVVMVAANIEAYAVCRDLAARGVHIAAIVDLRDADGARDAARARDAAGAPDADRAGVGADAVGVGADEAACASLGIPILEGFAPYEAFAGADGRVCTLAVAPIDGAGHMAPAARGIQRIECDAVLMSVGFAPAGHLLLQAGAGAKFSAGLQQFVPVDLPAGLFAAGRVNGVYDFAARLADGRRAGAQAAAQAGFGAGSAAPIERSTRRPSHPFPIFTHPAGKNFVDFDEDLQVKDLENAAQEGFDSSELLKRFSTVGMGPSQGKHSHMNALRILARLRRVGVEELGLTTFRPMYHPVPLKLLAGRPVAAARVLRRRGRESRAEHRGRGRGGAYPGRTNRCKHARENRGVRPRGRSVPRPGIYRQLRESESRHDALRLHIG
jgi:sarcosine oxidase subunit alpha